MKRECGVCGNMVTVRKDGNLRSHKNKGEVCPGAQVIRVAGESIEEKAARYLTEGRVEITSVTSRRVHALVRGSQPDPYEVWFTGVAWVCSCEAQTWRCSHVVAVQLVVSSRFENQATEPVEERSDPELDGLLGERFVQRQKEDASA